ncbi:hypothetical protein ASPVEDRAFT_152831 [Aspergillus versicolor CBS 583.65]|uniref:Secreted protein n=1 Tax=Aspergillus versicolor CBS 583.65 TaxID=1036611 RepID=A0A1L9PSQ2_ASPVE|nr:uncharacterized protein ASPVEDRAFT_152831 [Aspergillus versicolor CBS 583.65]OJJ04482.1 hypothetical protein ASPVEDRAFT_152831 [Aspergillus versicolor CBS 583.65]
MPKLTALLFLLLPLRNHTRYQINQNNPLSSTVPMLSYPIYLNHHAKPQHPRMAPADLLPHHGLPPILQPAACFLHHDGHVLARLGRHRPCVLFGRSERLRRAGYPGGIAWFRSFCRVGWGGLGWI